MDKLILGGVEFKSRLLTGTGKFSSKDEIPKMLKASGSQIMTMALRRVNFNNSDENILNYIPKGITLLPNTSGARNAEEAIKIARIARAAGCGDFIKIEIINDMKYLMPDNAETIKATKVLASEGFIVLPYMTPDLIAGQRLKEAGAAAVLVNTAIACSPNPAKMGEAALAVKAGRMAYRARMVEETRYANASSPLTGFLHNN